MSLLSLTHSPSFVQWQVPLELWQSVVSDPTGHNPVCSSYTRRPRFVSLVLETTGLNAESEGLRSLRTHSPSLVQKHDDRYDAQSAESDPAGHRPVISSQSPSFLHAQVSQSAVSVPAEQRPVPPGSSHQPSLVHEQIAQSATSVLSAHRPVPPGSSCTNATVSLRRSSAIGG
eukprot:COSAG04_NODE_765_length_10500_cov_7.566869_9_plen_173_part_00